MKKGKNLKIFALLVVLALTLGAIFAVSSFAEGQAKTPKIIAKNIEYGGNFAMMFAVDPATVEAGEVTLKMYKSDKTTLVGTYTKSAAEDMYPDDDTKNDAAFIFTTKGVPAKDMANVYYVQAEDSAGNKSEMLAYSVLEYMLESLYGPYKSDDADQRALYEAVLEMGAKAQTVLINNKTDDPTQKVNLTTDYAYVNVTGGTLENGKTTAVVLSGSQITVTPEGANTAWNVTGVDETIESVEGNTVTVTKHCTISPAAASVEDVYDPDSYHFNDIDMSTVADKTAAGSGVYLGEYGSNLGLESVDTTPGDDGLTYKYVGATIVQDTKANGAVSKVLKLKIIPKPSSSPLFSHVVHNISAETMIWQNDIEFSFDIKSTVNKATYPLTFRFMSGDSKMSEFYMQTVSEDGKIKWAFMESIKGADATADTVKSGVAVDEWNNIRIVLHTLGSTEGTATGARVDFYVNGTYVGSFDSWQNSYTSVVNRCKILIANSVDAEYLFDNISFKYVEAKADSEYPSAE